MSKGSRSYELREAMSRLIVKQGFFAMILLDLLTVVEGDDLPGVPTAATDGKHLFVNSRWFGKLSIDERVFVLCHEVLHVMLQHCPRMKLYIERGIGPDLKKWNPKKWGHATDYIINSWLTECKVGTMPVGGLYHPKFTKADQADELYCKLPDDPAGDGWDTHMPSTDEAPSTADVQRAVMAAASAARNMGNMPAGMERLVKDLCEPQLVWYDKLRLTLMQRAGRDQNTWARPHRRRLATPPHVYWPGRTGFGAGVIAMYEDTSGSVGDGELRSFRSEMAGLFDEMSPEELWIGSCDSEAYAPELVQDSSDIINYKSKGGGGTHMPAIFDKLDEVGIKPDTLVILTDGYTSFGTDPGYPVIWVITTDKKAPWGVNIHLNLTQ